VLALVAVFGAGWMMTFGHAAEEPDKLESAPSGPCKDTESCLAIIDSFLDRQPRQTYMPKGAGLMQTFGPDSFGGGDCGDKMCAGGGSMHSTLSQPSMHAHHALHPLSRSRLPHISF